MLTPWKESYDQHRQHIKKQRHYFAYKGPSSQGYGFTSGHVWIWELDCEESWALKIWCFWTGVLEKTLESSLDCKEIQPVHPKGDQSWVFIGRTDAEVETPVLWPCYEKSWLIWKDPDAGKVWGQEEKGTTEDEMVGWHYRLNGHRFGWTLGVGDGQGGLVCCGSWGHRVGHDWVTELNWNDAVGIILTVRDIQEKHTNKNVLLYGTSLLSPKETFWFISNSLWISKVNMMKYLVLSLFTHPQEFQIYLLRFPWALVQSRSWSGAFLEKAMGKSK